LPWTKRQTNPIRNMARAAFVGTTIISRDGWTLMKEENDDEKKEAVRKGMMGPGKMANFVYRAAKDVIRQKWSKELTEPATTA